MAGSVIKVDFPTRGKHTDLARAGQPPQTTVDAVNTMLYDATHRARGGKRPGLTKWMVPGGGPGPNHGGAITFMMQANSAAGVAHLVTVGGSGVFLDGVLCTGASVPTLVYGMACIQGVVYILDTGSNLLVLNLGTGVITSMVASAGALPASGTVISAWRNRLVIAAGKNWYMSRPGAPTDFDYTQTDVSRAIYAGGFAALSPGYIGDPIISIMPFTRDQLIFGLDREIWKMNADPADRGQLELVTQGEGVVAMNGWTTDTTGTLWIMGTSGLHRYGGAVLEPYKQDVLTSFFANITQGTNLRMAWDRDRVGLWIFTPSETVWWDMRGDGPWPMRFAQTVQSAIVFDGNLPNDRRILLGCTDGYIRVLDDTADDDDGIAFDWHLWLGPYQLSGATQRFRILNAQFIMAESNSAQQIDRLTPGSVAAGRVYSLSVANTLSGNTASVSYTAVGGDDATAVCNGIIRAIQSCATPPINVMLATLDTGTILLSGQPGISFTATPSATGGATFTKTSISAAGNPLVQTVDWTIQTGKTVYSAYGDPEQYVSGMFAGVDRMTTVAIRLTGNAAFIRVGGSSTVSRAALEQVAISVVPSGRQR